LSDLLGHLLLAASGAAVLRRASLAAVGPSRRAGGIERKAVAAGPPVRWPPGPPCDGWTGPPAGWLAGRLPAGGDQCVELRAHQVVVAQHEIDEDLGLVVCLLGAGRPHRIHLIENVNVPRRSWWLIGAAGQASICLRSLSELAIAILRGLARSATGILSVSTPAS
jgi:hypothetical protein